MELNRIEQGIRVFRLAGYDYSSPGAYFITICTNNREICFGELKNGVMIFNKYDENVKNDGYGCLNNIHI
ncbi:MAG: hypothetical protein PF637_07360 [Spirochaetes bacterium]|jgi:putative transposase|nr:hypothetical protein [Spirochaetota bacterium]